MLYKHKRGQSEDNMLSEFACSLVRHERTGNFSIESQLCFKYLSVVKNFKEYFSYEDNFFGRVTQKELFKINIICGNQPYGNHMSYKANLIRFFEIGIIYSDKPFSCIDVCHYIRAL